MQRLLLPLLIVCLVAGSTASQETAQKPDAKTPRSEHLRLADLLKKHDSQINQLQTADISWSVAYTTGSGEAKTEKFRTTLPPDFQATTTWSTSGKPTYCWWDGERFARISGFSPHEGPATTQKVMRARTELYLADLPIKHLFDWRTLRSYRLFASDSDLSFRELCDRSTTKPKITKQGGLIRLEVGHPGVEAQKSMGTPGITQGTPIHVDLDPQHGCLVKRYETAFTIGEGDAAEEVTQILEVLEYEQLTGELFMPGKVRYSLVPTKSEWKNEQIIEFKYSHVNEPIDPDPLKFPANLGITEWRQYGDNKPLGYYVTSESGELGSRYASEIIARAIQGHRLGFLDDATLKSQLAILRNVPDVGEAAPPISGLGLVSGNDETVSFEGRVTAIEFWSTTCGPCQGAMAKFDKLAAVAKKRWADKVQFVTISLDDDVDAAHQRMKDKGWSNTEALVDNMLEASSAPRATFPFSLAHKYVVSGIPTCLIVDQKGQIAYRANVLDDRFDGVLEKLLDEK